MSEDKKEAASSRAERKLKETANAQLAKAPEKLMYIGPTIVDDDGAFVLKKNTLYSNGLPSDVTEYIRKYDHPTDKHLSKLFVVISKAKKMLALLNDKKSYLSISFNFVNNAYLRRRAKKEG